MSHSPRDMSGQRFGRLVALRLSPERESSGRARWECVCDCGRTVDVRASHLTTGKIQSCGCLRKEVVSTKNANRERKKKEWVSRKSYTFEYSAWTSMISRCTKEKDISYHRYGGRGIKVCDRWLVFENFRADMGNKPGYDYSLDRIDNNGNYEPGNCRWATRAEQDSNKRTNRYLEHNGQRLTISEWSRRTGINLGTIQNRLTSGMTVKEALETPVAKRKGRSG